MFAGEAVRRFLQRRAQDEIHWRAHQLLSLTRHFQQIGGGYGSALTKGYEQVHIAVGSGLFTRSRAEYFQFANAVLLAERTKQLPQFCDRRGR